VPSLVRAVVGLALALDTTPGTLLVLGGEAGPGLAPTPEARPARRRALRQG
jgi:hypothetical protein